MAKKSKHIVAYIGQGIWTDGKGKLWGNHPSNDNIKIEREFENDKSKEEFLKDRSDIAFMVKYGQMRISTMTIDDESADKTEGKETVTSDQDKVESEDTTVDNTDKKDSGNKVSITVNKK